MTPNTMNVNLMPTPEPVFSPDLVAAPTPTPQPRKPREFGDVSTTRKNIYDQVLKAASEITPVSNQQHTLSLKDVRYTDPDHFTLADQKHALLSGRSIGRRLRGTWELSDNATGNVLDSKTSLLGTVPHLTHRGTYIHNGNEYTLRNQQRLLPGVFVREKENGELEAHANILPGHGVSHRYHLDPEKGVFYLDIQQAKIPLLPLLKAAGATPRQLQEAWGTNLYAANASKDEAAAYQKLKHKMLKPADLLDQEESQREKLVRKFAEMRMDPDVNQKTLGKPHTGLTLDAMLDVTKKLLAVSRKEADVDDRDALSFQQFLGPEELFAERIRRDYGSARRKLLWQASGKGHLRSMPSSAMQDQIESTLFSSGLGQPLEEINPAEIYDKLHSVSRLGEGGIPSIDSIPDEARTVQPSHTGFIDLLRTPESFRVGVDLYLARGARKGDDGKLYSQFKDPRTGELVYKTPQEVASMAITFPSALARYQGKRVPAMSNGKLTWVKKRDVDLVMPNFEDTFSPLSNMIPIKSMVKGQRAVMASRMLTQALPMASPEAPLVQAGMAGSGGARSYEQEYAKQMGALHAEQPGRVMEVTPEAIKMQYADGRTEEHELYHHFPFNRKTFLHQTPMVKQGDVVQPGQLLAKSNYTDDSGTAALGTNLRVAYIPWGGQNFEDANVISASAAKKMSSEHYYQHGVDVDQQTKLGKKHYIANFPGSFDRKTLAKLDDRGVIQPGETVEYGQPLILAARERAHSENKVHRQKQAGWSDASVTWDHHDAGVVTDVVEGKNGPVVSVKSISPMQVGDKMSGRYGDKGVIAAIIPDHQMPHDANGKPFEVLLNPLGVITRTNPAQKVEAMLGKIAAARGTPFKVEDWDSSKDMTEWAIDELRKAGLSDTEDIIDPNRDQKIRGIATGNRFFMKLHHTAESKGQARGSGAYTAEEQPAKGGESGSKRVALLDTNALLAHGATETLRDISTVRGQRNEEYWLKFMQGYNPRTPRVPMVYRKFVDQLKGAGINVIPHGTQLNLMAMTSKDVDQLAGNRFLSHADTVRWDKDLKPIPGGLFDKALTGGHGGDRWSAIKLDEALPNPVMEEPIRRLLNLTTAQFESVLSGDHELGQFGSGPQALSKALENLNVDKEIESARAMIHSGSRTSRDMAVRKLGYLKSAKTMGLHPKDWMLNKVPVIPPIFRPISMMSNNLPLVADANYLYKELLEADKNLQSMKGEVGDTGAGAERLAVYHAFKAVTGLGQPISQKSQEKGVKGLLQHIFGGSPKYGTVQRKLLSTTVDNVGRAVITPNSSYDMDTVGIPEDKAYDIYGKFVARRLHRQGMPLTAALNAIKEKSPLAKKMLMEEMNSRPVFINRAPVLHKFGIMAFRPQIVAGDTMQVSPLIVKGFNADFDGDAMQFHVPTDSAAAKEAAERMLPSRLLLSPADFKTPVHMPMNEYLTGLYEATSKDRQSKRPKQIFHTKKDAIAAYERGSISHNDLISILE